MQEASSSTIQQPSFNNNNVNNYNNNTNTNADSLQSQSVPRSPTTTTTTRTTTLLHLDSWKSNYIESAATSTGPCPPAPTVPPAPPNTNGFLYLPDSNSNDSGFKSAETRIPQPQTQIAYGLGYHKLNFQQQQHETEPSYNSKQYNNSSISSYTSYSLKSSSPEELLSPSPPTDSQQSASVPDDGDTIIEPIDWGSDSEEEEIDQDVVDVSRDRDVVDTGSGTSQFSLSHLHQQHQHPPPGQGPGFNVQYQYQYDSSKSKSKSPPDFNSQVSPEHAQQSKDPLGLLSSTSTEHNDQLSLLLPSSSTSPPPPPEPVIPLREVEPWEVDRLHSEKIECLNGNYCPEGEFREWHETYTVQTYGDENLLILPYTVIDF